MRKKTRNALLCTLAAMAVLTGCGGDKKETAAAPAEGTTTAAVTEAAKTEAETTAAVQTEESGEKNLIMVTLGTGVGGGVIVNGQPVVGAHGAGGL